ncbi:hypothetical protein [Embleya sp. NPDC020630]|uniref:SCO4402 family protein n=1 Tax=Embleya sp. NPDC020630 TaxID=3363979 RepID=UPI0037A5E7EC
MGFEFDPSDHSSVMWRYNIIDITGKLADLEWQNSIWGDSEASTPYGLRFDDFITFLFDDSQILAYPLEMKESLLLDDDEVSAAIELGRALDAIIDGPEIHENDLMSSPGWPHVVMAAKELWVAMARRGSRVAEL